MREEVIKGMKEGKLPGYQADVERYFKNLVR